MVHHRERPGDVAIVLWRRCCYTPRYDSKRPRPFPEQVPEVLITREPHYWHFIIIHDSPAYHYWFRLFRRITLQRQKPARHSWTEYGLRASSSSIQLLASGSPQLYSRCPAFPKTNIVSPALVHRRNKIYLNCWGPVHSGECGSELSPRFLPRSPPPCI